MGRILETPAQQFVIHPDGNAMETMSGFIAGRTLPSMPS